MVSPTQWTWVWASSGCWWWTGKPGVLQPMGSQRVGLDWATELNWKQPRWCYSDHWWPIRRCLLEMTVLFLHITSPDPSSVYRSAHPLLVMGWAESALVQMSTTLPRVAGIWNKMNFPFHQPGLYTAFWAVSSWTPHIYLLVTWSQGDRFRTCHFLQLREKKNIQQNYFLPKGEEFN